jgi:ABC-2 type transport system permease protein
MEQVLRQTWAFFFRDYHLTRRYFSWVVVFTFYAVVNSATVVLIGVAAGDRRLTLTLMVGVMLWGLLSVVFQEIANSITYERWEGTLEYTFMAPIRRYTQLLGSCVYAMGYGLVHTAVILVVMMIFFRQLDLSVQNVPTAMVFVVLGSFSFVGIGMMAAILPLLYVERGAQMTFVLQSCLLLVSGVYYPVEVLPPWMQVLSRLSPATYVLDGVRAGLLDGVPVSALMHDVVPLVVMGIVLIPAGIWAFGRAERYAKRTGKLKRVG